MGLRLAHDSAVRRSEGNKFVGEEWGVARLDMAADQAVPKSKEDSLTSEALGVPSDCVALGDDWLTRLRLAG